MAQDEFESGLAPLWALAQAGDETAYRQALMLIATRLRVYFSRRLHSWPNETEDLVQETLLALHLQRGTYDPRWPISAWVFAIARHKLMDLFRRHGRHGALNDPLDELDDTRHPASSDEPSSARDLALLLESLPPAQCAAIVMTRIEGLSMAEASGRSGVSVTALKVQVHRGLKRLALLVRNESP